MRRRARPLLGTLVEIGVKSDLPDDAFNALVNQAFARVDHIHHCMSFHDPNSELSQINRLSPGQTMMLSEHTAQVLNSALQIAQWSGGLFNPGVAPRLVAWGYSPPPEPRMPACRALEQLFQIHDRVLTKTASGWVDLGGIAKGYAVDQALAFLRDTASEHPVDGAVVNAGGDLAVFGLPEFPVLIRDPAQPNQALGTLYLSDQALATSACYYSMRLTEGQTRSALVNPWTLEAVTTARSASVRAPTCMLADALTKVVITSGHVNHPWMETLGAKACLLPEPADMIARGLS